MANILRYGAYLPKYRAQLGEVQSFYGRPGRPRSKTLSTPGLDEDTLTMAYEAGLQALGGLREVAAVVTVTMSAPFGMRKLSATLARALGLGDSVPAFDLAGHPGSLLDALEVAERLSGDGPVLVVAADHVVAHEDRVCDMLSAGGAAAFLVGTEAGVASLGASARSGAEVYDVWRLGTEPEARYRMEVLFDAYAAAAAGAMGALQKSTGVATGDYAVVAASQPHPQSLRSLARTGVTGEQLSTTSFVGEIGNLGVASVGLALCIALDGATPGQKVLAFGYGAGEGIARSVEVTGSAPSGAADRIAGEPITMSTYYRWTRGRQAEPH